LLSDLETAVNVGNGSVIFNRIVVRTQGCTILDSFPEFSPILQKFFDSETDVLQFGAAGLVKYLALE
jgi:hypothetical protein